MLVNYVCPFITLFIKIEKKTFPELLENELIENLFVGQKYLLHGMSRNCVFFKTILVNSVMELRYQHKSTPKFTFNEIDTQRLWLEFMLVSQVLHFYIFLWFSEFSRFKLE